MKNFFIALLLVLAVLLGKPPQAQAMETPYLSASYLGADKVALWWNQVGASNYQVWYGPTDNPYAHAVALGEGTQYVVQALFRNTSYVFTVKGLRGGDTTGVSNPMVVRVGANGRPPVEQAMYYYYAPQQAQPVYYVAPQPVYVAPQTVYVAPAPVVYAPVAFGAYGTYQGWDRVSLWWNEVPGATYQVWYGPKDNPYAHNVTLGAGTQHTVQALFRNTSYVFTVRALVNGNVTSQSNWVSAYVGANGRWPL